MNVSKNVSVSVLKSVVSGGGGGGLPSPPLSSQKSESGMHVVPSGQPIHWQDSVNQPRFMNGRR